MTAAGTTLDLDGDGSGSGTLNVTTWSDAATERPIADIVGITITGSAAGLALDSNA